MDQEQLRNLFQEASKHHSTRNISSSEEQSYMYLGVKISKQHDLYLLQLANTNFYTDLNLDTTFKDGWVVGVNKIKRLEYEKQLNKIEKDIAYEMNNEKNFSDILELRSKREYIIKKINNTRKTLKHNNHE